MEGTTRQRIRELLQGGERSLREISQELRISEKEALDHLEHLAKVKGPGRLIITPAACPSCGFTFEKRKRLGKPSRCPVCKSEHVTGPRYRI
jgi:predicted Zn-ribbon and HTH transcriptional regulator